jgi:DNA modification methylase
MDTYRDGVYLNIVEEFICEMVQKGFFVLDKWVWAKKNSTPISTRGANISHEHLICFGVNPNLPFNEMKVECDAMKELKEWSYNNGSKMKSSILVNEKVIESNANDFNELMKKCVKRGIPFTHSAGFPIEIPSLLIALSTEPGDLVVDLFSGTATTGEASLSLKRRYVGYEINPAYHEIAQVRLEDYITGDVIPFLDEDEEYLGEFFMAA